MVGEGYPPPFMTGGAIPPHPARSGPTNPWVTDFQPGTKRYYNTQFFEVQFDQRDTHVEVQLDRISKCAVPPQVIAFVYFQRRHLSAPQKNSTYNTRRRCAFFGMFLSHKQRCLLFGFICDIFSQRMQFEMMSMISCNLQWLVSWLSDPCEMCILQAKQGKHLLQQFHFVRGVKEW